jgi:predicted ATPase
MSLSAISIKGYRSVRNTHVNIGQISTFVGANGVGKTNLYKSLAMLQAATKGTVTRAIAGEGGIESVLWAGKRNKSDPARLCLKAHFDELFFAADGGIPHTYEIEIGVPQPTEAGFTLEPMIKLEKIVMLRGAKKITMMERKASVVSLRNATGAMETFENAVLPSETALASFRDAATYPELEAIRRELLEWWLYHDFRSDADSDVRKPAHAITTPTMAADGNDLAATLATLHVIREDTSDIDAAIEDSFPGARLDATGNRDGFCTFTLAFPDMPQRQFSAPELSDGTLKYLCLLGALMGYRLPPLVALNEPEASLHPGLLPPLARLIARAAEKSQVWVVTHSDILADALEEETGKRPGRIVKEDGATTIEGLTIGGDYGE